jgi:uncharacterized OB-fold protein
LIAVSSSNNHNTSDGPLSDIDSMKPDMSEGEENMKNVEMKLEGDILTIKVDITKEFGPSASGKTIIIASTEGNISIPEKDSVKIGMNVYRKK